MNVEIDQQSFLPIKNDFWLLRIFFHLRLNSNFQEKVVALMLFSTFLKGIVLHSHTLRTWLMHKENRGHNENNNYIPSLWIKSLLGSQK